MAATVEEFREYLVNPPDSNERLQLYLDAARAKAKAAGIPDFKKNAQYDLFIYALAAMYHDNKGMAFSGAYQATAEETAKKMIDGFVLELRYSDPEDGDGG